MLPSLLLGALLVSRPYLGVEALVTPEVRYPAGAEVIAVNEPRGAYSVPVWAPDGASLWLETGPSIYRLDAATGAVIDRIDVAHDDETGGFALSADGTRLAATTLDGTVTVWDAQTGFVLRRVFLDADDLDEYVAISPDNARVLTVTYAEAARDEVMSVTAWDIASGRKVGSRRLHENLRPGALFFRPLRLAGDVIYFDDTSLLARAKPVRACAGTPPFPSLMAGADAFGWYGSVGVRRIDDCAVVGKSSAALATAEPVDLAIVADGRYAAYGRDAGGRAELGLIDVAADVVLARVEFTGVDLVSGFGAAPDGSQLAAAIVMNRGDEAVRTQILVLWRPQAIGAAPARVLVLELPGSA